PVPWCGVGARTRIARVLRACLASGYASVSARRLIRRLDGVAVSDRTLRSRDATASPDAAALRLPPRRTARRSPGTAAAARAGDVLLRLCAEPGPHAIRLGQRAGDALGDAEVGVEVRGGVVGLRRVRHVQAQRLVDDAPAR